MSFSIPRSAHICQSFQWLLYHTLVVEWKTGVWNSECDSKLYQELILLLIDTGLIIYGDKSLLLDPKSSSPKKQQSIAGLIAHEIAHMWYGDLVTCDWWSNTWLNEGRNHIDFRLIQKTANYVFIFQVSPHISNILDLLWLVTFPFTSDR